ncbi:hypothetical protein HPB58_16495 [Priestia filamentosa]|uniref:hypothetical protein n=1 Tax=Priestia filamentosa TaxID=1402861 RepID=UPI001FB3A3B5|nr:hypothetical protein [Priestia filamentosa]UOE58922.1 hypothetical protein HPB58_16495 [Priestia filamentosa]
MNEEQWNGNSDKIPKAYWTKEVAESLGISDSYLRKWCLELEKNGYTFLKVKDGKNRENRAFTEHDVIALRKFQSVLKQPNITKSQVAEMIAKDYAPTERDTMELSTFLRDNDRDKAQQEVNHLMIQNIIHELKGELEDMEVRIAGRIGKQFEEQMEKHLNNIFTKYLDQKEERIEERLSHLVSERLERHEERISDTIEKMKSIPLNEKSPHEETEGVITELKKTYLEHQQQNEVREKELQQQLVEREQQLQDVLKELENIKEQIAVSKEKKSFFQRLFSKS